MIFLLLGLLAQASTSGTTSATTPATTSTASVTLSPEELASRQKALATAEPSAITAIEAARAEPALLATGSSAKTVDPSTTLGQ